MQFIGELSAYVVLLMVVDTVGWGVFEHRMRRVPLMMEAPPVLVTFAVIRCANCASVDAVWLVISTVGNLGEEAVVEASFKQRTLRKLASDWFVLSSTVGLL